MSFGLGELSLGETLTVTLNTHSPSTGSTANADTPPTYRVYEEITTTPILTGTSAALDTGSTVGFYALQLALTAANGFERGKSYTIRVLATVGGINSALIYHFSIDRYAYVYGTVVTDTGNSLTQFKTDLSETSNSHWNRAFVRFETGALSGQIDRIIGYDGTSKILTVGSGFTAIPAVGTTFILLNR